ncbi:MAG TPA: glycosyltransferase, partial [Terriglobales bacterium]|nr:glycosyltransferase [Terriglobales bacterium]
MNVWGVSGYDPWWGTLLPPDILDRQDAGGIAGGETMMLEQCFALAERGDTVHLFSDVFAPGTHRGVRFHTMRDFVAAVLQWPDPDVVLAWKNPEALSDVPDSAARILVQQCNDLDYTPGWRSFVDAIVAASANHAALFRSFGYDGVIEVVHNGCHLERYPIEALVAPQERAPVVGYWSSPDRGLHHLLAAWPFVREKRPDAELRVHYEIQKIFEFTKSAFRDTGVVNMSLGRVALVRKAIESARRLPGVTFTGMLPRNELIRSQLETRVFAYPCDPICYTEGFGASVAEAMA